MPPRPDARSTNVPGSGMRLGAVPPWANTGTARTAAEATTKANLRTLFKICPPDALSASPLQFIGHIGDVQAESVSYQKQRTTGISRPFVQTQEAQLLCNILQFTDGKFPTLERKLSAQLCQDTGSAVLRPTMTVDKSPCRKVELFVRQNMQRQRAGPDCTRHCWGRSRISRL